MGLAHTDARKMVRRSVIEVRVSGETLSSQKAIIHHPCRGISRKMAWKRKLMIASSTVVRVEGKKSPFRKSTHDTAVNSCFSFYYLRIGNGVEKVQQL
ncbi:MAG: hypothetical protein ABJL35_02210 [Parasphingorhabdus sp.]|uniref:hypothetical protein n=1 Tax=Parasphingorhabdus sp. TaxID=2709688 RepID=UPI00329731CA